MRKNRKIILIFLISVFVIVGTILAIDHYRMNNNLPVLFSTWGRDYSPKARSIKYTSTGTAEYLFSLKRPYIGGLPEKVVGRALEKLDIGAYGHYTFELKYTNEPYALVINYSVVEGWGNILNNPQTVIEKSAILLALIDNVDEIHWILPNSNEIYKVTRNDLDAEYGNIKDYGRSVNNFKQLLIKLGYYEENEPITMSIDKLTNTGLTLTIKNHTNNRYNYGLPYSLERLDNSWEKVKQIKDNCAFILIGYTLKEKQKYKEKINWEPCYGKLPKGQYRITKDFTHIISETESSFKFGKRHYISAEFTLN
jgi:hypothetical protein